MKLNHVSEGMSKGLQDNDAAKPTVDKIEAVERDVEETDERIVTTGHNYQGYHVDN